MDEVRKSRENGGFIKKVALDASFVTRMPEKFRVLAGYSSSIVMALLGHWVSQALQRRHSSTLTGTDLLSLIS